MLTYIAFYIDTVEMLSLLNFEMTISRKNTLDMYITYMFLYFSMKTINILYLQGSGSFMSITISKMSK